MYEVDEQWVDKFFYRRLRTHTCDTREEAIEKAVTISQKQGTATLFATNASGIVTCTLFVHGKVQGINNIGA